MQVTWVQGLGSGPEATQVVTGPAGIIASNLRSLEQAQSSMEFWQIQKSTSSGTLQGLNVQCEMGGSWLNLRLIFSCAVSKNKVNGPTDQ